MGTVAVIMAGGRGERFWPHSREDRPKQFLAFRGERTLLQQTVTRLGGCIPMEDTWVVTREDYAPLVQDQLPFLDSARLLLEPEGRDTAPCIALAAFYIAKTDPNAVMVVLPADHLVLQEDRFREVLRSAVELAQSGEYLVTIGIQPTRPETGYGYIRLGQAHEWSGSHAAYRVAAFTEKPIRETAMAYLQDGGYLWNSGIFVWRVDTIRKAIQANIPGLWEGLEPLRSAIGSKHERDELRRIYPTLPKISIDYGVMERAVNTLVLPADFGWDDLGTWASLERVFPADEDGNVIAGRVLAVDTRDSVIQAQPDRLVVTYGLSDVVVVDTQDAVLVANKRRVSDLKAVVGRLEAVGLNQHLRSVVALVPNDLEK